MFLHVSPDNQQRFHGVIGFEKSMTDFFDDFEQLAPMLVRAMPEYLALPNNMRFERGATVPIIHLDTDRKYRFTTAGWGRIDTEKSYREYVRRCDQSPNELIALICASYFDIMFETPRSDGSVGVRLRDAVGGALYIGARYWLTRERFISAVAPFVVEAGWDVERYVDWQPQLVAREYVLAFLSNSFPTAALGPTPRGSLKIEILFNETRTVGRRKASPAPSSAGAATRAQV